jgi:thiol-disulfide isomerase/thioredoxin
MLQRTLALFVLFIFCFTSPVYSEVLVRGKIRNVQPGQVMEVYVPHFYIDNSSSSYKTFVNADGTFSVVAETPEPQLIFIRLGEDYLPVFAETSDTIIINFDFFEFPRKVLFDGRNAGNNILYQKLRPVQANDFIEFNNVRYKVGQTWFGIETSVNDSMLALSPPLFKTSVDQTRRECYAMADSFYAASPSACSPGFRQWFESEVAYTWGYYLLVYGAVFKNRYQIQPEFFEFTYEAPINGEIIGSEAFRQYVACWLAYHQSLQSPSNLYFTGQYQLATEHLQGKTLAYCQSEIIRMAFSADQYQQILPSYAHFLKNNPYPVFEPKIISLYEKAVRVAPGTPAPDFRGHDAGTGRSVGLSDFKGKVVYVNFWASYCGACIKKMDVFNAFSADLAKEGIVIVNVSIDDKQETWKRTLTEFPSAGYHLWAKGGSNQADIQQLFGVEAVPQYFILTRSGTFAEKSFSNQPMDIQKRLLDIAKGL